MVDRAPQWPPVNAFYKVVGEIMADGKKIPSDIDQAPDCDPPYFIVKAVNETVDGSMWSPEADSSLRIQLIAIGTDGALATLLLDKGRAAINKTALNAHMTNHKIIRVTLDSNRGTMREERGLPEPFFSKIDQYLLHITPGTP